MASVFSRKGTHNLWIKFRHPATGETVRLSLDTGDPARAEIMRQKVEAWQVLQDPRIAHIDLPPALAFTGGSAVDSAPQILVTPTRPAVDLSEKRKPITTVVLAFCEWCREQNSPQHARSKIGYLRRFFGEDVVPGNRLTNRGRGPVKPFCAAACLEDIPVEVVLTFIRSVSESVCTRRHRHRLEHSIFGRVPS